jgi:peptidoglycan-N-acetylglucosamine deacetylase
MKLITTSWDDGHPNDFKLAELLDKYNLAGTFYIPQSNAEHEVMSTDQIIRLSKKFEIGGHSLSHLSLDTNNVQFINDEVSGSFNWLKSLLGKDPISFCFPKGRFNDLTLCAVFNSGYKIARTTELLSSIDIYRNNLAPTTLQLYNHSSRSYLINIIKRGKWSNFINWMRAGSPTLITKLSEKYIEKILKGSGCFHLWGHSWEIDEYGLWDTLEKVMKIISNISEFRYIQNKELLTC